MPNNPSTTVSIPLSSIPSNVNANTKPALNPVRSDWEDKAKTPKASESELELAMMREAVEEVAGIVTGDRHKCYGTPSENHGVTASMFSAFLSRKLGQTIVLTSSDVCWFNILQKASREAHWSKRDNAIDVAGYAMNAIACSET